MISVKQLAEVFENGLNEVLNNPEIQFKIWASAGKYQKPQRDGNTVNYEIVGNLRTSTSANDANSVLVMGVNGVAIEFMVPVYPPRTNAKQTEAELAKIKDGQYPFIEYICNAINGYFQTAKSLSLTDEEGNAYAVAFAAGTVIPGAVDIQPGVGNALPVTVYVQVYFIQEGTNSKDIKISVDGQLMPFQGVRIGRTGVTERDVYAGETVSKSLNSSTVFSVDADFPASVNPATDASLSYLLDGEPNTAHFVNVEWSTGVQNLFFMMQVTGQAAIAGISVVGLTASYTEISGNSAVYTLPQGFKTVRFTFNDSSAQTLSFTLSEECETFIAGIGAAKRDGAQSVSLNSLSFEWNEEAGVYAVNMVVDKSVTVSNASASFTVV